MVLSHYLLMIMQLEGLWISYRTTSFSEKDIYVTIPRFSILDIRPGTKHEMRLMLGSDVSREGLCGIPGSNGNFLPSFTDDGSVRKDSASTDADVPNLTMLLMDYRVRPSSQSFVIRIQQPRVLVVLDFLLAVCEFFVPALGTITGREEILDARNDPISKNNNIILSSHIYKQKDDLVHLSSTRQLIVDAFGIDEFTYDGCGGTICLSDEVDLTDDSTSKTQPIIIIGRGKKLRFKNIKIEVFYFRPSIECPEIRVPFSLTSLVILLVDHFLYEQSASTMWLTYLHLSVRTHL